MENYSLSNPFLLTFTQNDYTLVWANYIMYLLLYCCSSSNINFYLKKYATLIISEFRMGEHPPPPPTHTISLCLHTCIHTVLHVISPLNPIHLPTENRHLISRGYTLLYMYVILVTPML